MKLDIVTKTETVEVFDGFNYRSANGGASLSLRMNETYDGIKAYACLGDSTIDDEDVSYQRAGPLRVEFTIAEAYAFADALRELACNGGGSVA